MMEIKTTKQIKKSMLCGAPEALTAKAHINFINKQWVSLEELKAEIRNMQSYGHARTLIERKDITDDNLICVGELLKQLSVADKRNE